MRSSVRRRVDHEKALRTRARARRHPTPADDRTWRFQRALTRVGPTTDKILAEHATSYWQRGFNGREVAPTPEHPEYRAVWTIDHERVLELRVPECGASTLVVIDFSLYEPLNKALRTRHVQVRHATARDFDLI